MHLQRGFLKVLQLSNIKHLYNYFSNYFGTTHIVVTQGVVMEFTRAAVTTSDVAEKAGEATVTCTAESRPVKLVAFEVGV